MPFRLKNTGATYQWEMTVIFHDMIHDIMEDYVDEILGKSKTREDHLVILRHIFEHLREYKVRINPNKCVFSVLSGKILGFVVSRRGIEYTMLKCLLLIKFLLLRILSKYAAYRGKSRLSVASSPSLQISVTHSPTFLKRMSPSSRDHRNNGPLLCLNNTYPIRLSSCL